jgi:hypothetical protein
MFNMAQIREERRKMRIDGIRRQVINNWKVGKDTDYNQLLYWTMQTFSVARRTANKYIDITLFPDEFDRLGDYVFYKKVLSPDEEEVIEKVEVESQGVAKPINLSNHPPETYNTPQSKSAGKRGTHLGAAENDDVKDIRPNR